MCMKWEWDKKADMSTPDGGFGVIWESIFENVFLMMTHRKNTKEGKYNGGQEGAISSHFSHWRTIFEGNFVSLTTKLWHLASLQGRNFEELVSY